MDTCYIEPKNNKFSGKVGLPQSSSIQKGLFNDDDVNNSNDDYDDNVDNVNNKEEERFSNWGAKTMDLEFNFFLPSKANN